MILNNMVANAWTFCGLNEAKSVAGKSGCFYMSNPLVAVADILCPNCSKLALLEGQQMATQWVLDIMTTSGHGKKIVIRQ